jgi:hypothetical protein
VIVLATKKQTESQAPASQGAPPEIVALDWGEPQWDTETKEDLQEWQARFRDNNAYLNAPLFKAMESVWGRGFAAIRTITNEETREVFVYKSSLKEPGAVPVRRIGAQNTAEINLFRPMAKLEIKVPSDRIFVVKPYRSKMTKVGEGFVFPMAKYRSEPRKEAVETAAEADESKAVEVIEGAPATQPALAEQE